MASDLETNLVAGGISPAAAKILANAIANVASSRTDIGRRYGDSTPTQQLRMVTSDTRRYLLGNLDQPRDGAFRRRQRSPDGKYRPRDTSHTYSGSQPSTANPTLTDGAVADGDYVSSTQTTANSVAQSKVGLKVTEKGGQHARLNPATKAVEAVPFLVENDQEQFIEAKFEERPEGTVLKLRLRNLDKLFTFTTNKPDLITGTFTPTATGIALAVNLNGIQSYNDLQNDPFWAWER